MKIGDGSITHKNTQQYFSTSMWSFENITKDRLCEKLGLDKKKGSIILIAQSRNIYTALYDIVNLVWYDNTEITLTHLLKDYEIVKLDSNGAITGDSQNYGFDYVIALATLGYNVNYF